MKNLFTILNLLFIAAMAYYLVDTVYKNLIPQNLILSDQKVYTIDKNNKAQGQNRPRIDKNLTNSIVKRNLFKVEIEPEPDTNIENQEKAPEALEPTTLKLILWGTVTGQENVYAVIEDQKVRKQDLYQIGDLVQGARLKKILRNRVILNFQGKDQVLEIQTDYRNIPKLKNFKEKTDIEPFLENRDIKRDFLPDNLNSMMRQIKFRPHFSEGQADGLMVYGIRPNSVFRKIGLKNGDIIKDINGTPIISKDDISHLFTDIELEDDLKLTLFRRGKIKELSYTSFMDEDDKGEKE